MNKEDALWLAVRIFGLYLLVLAIMQIPVFFNNASNIYQEYKSSWSTGVLFRSHELANELYTSVVRTIVYTLAAFYFLRKGDFVFKIISPKIPKKQDEQKIDQG